MNRKAFTAIVILMGISIIGIILVQLVWMNNALKVRKQLFGFGVTEALNNTVATLEKQHDVGTLNNLVLNDSAVWVGKNVSALNGNVIATQQVSGPGKKSTIIREHKDKNGKTTVELRVNNDTTRANTPGYSYQIVSSGSNKSGSYYIFNNSSGSDSSHGMGNRQAFVTVNVDSLYRVGIVKLDSLQNTLDSVTVLSPVVSGRVKQKVGKLKNVATRIITEVSNWDADNVDMDQVRDILQKELDEQKISAGFEYGVLRDSVVSKRSENADSLKLVDSPFRANLYPNNVFQKGLELSVYFPHRGNFIYHSINWLLLVSFLFSMVMLVTFSLSIFYILRQKKISEMKSDFINNMTHEFKTPIATIGVATDSISNEKVLSDPGQIKYFLGMIRKENNRMNRQVEDILTIARLDKKEFEFKWEALNVHNLIRDVITGISIQAEKRSGHIKTDLKAANPVVTTDKFHGANVVYNLLDNAIKYSAGAPEIEIETRNNTKGVLIDIIDHGIGMTGAVQARIFEKFYRKPSGNIHNVKGFGLGLSYVKAVVEANKGSISVKSQPGVGSRFEIFLPFSREK